MDVSTAVDKFKTILNEQPDVSPAIAALTVLLEFLEKDTSETVQGLDANIRPVVDAFMRVDSVVTSVKSASLLFLRFITLTSLDQEDFGECKRVLCQRGKTFLETVSNARNVIAKLCLPYILNNYNILTHSHSRVVLQALTEAHKANKDFHVFVTESAPDYSGRLMYEKLQKAGIKCTLIIDAAISSIMERIDVVILGAESVVENGGIVNKIGTYGLARMAKFLNRRVYVLAESFKFARISPVNQRDLANELLLMDFDLGPPERARVDYTPPSLITLLYTNLGILTTSAVGDELIKLYE